MTTTRFEVFSGSHLATLGVVAAVAVGMVAVSRSQRWPGLTRRLEWGLAGLLLLCWPAEWLAARSINYVTWEEILPLHLCDLAAFAGAAALIWHHRFAAELTYFWAVAGTLNGLITPTVKYAFPHPTYFAFFLMHGGVVATATYLVAGKRFWPRPGAVWRVFAASCVYLAAIAGVNWLLGTNFAFVRHKPESASLLDVLGGWPWYVLALVPLALVTFGLLYLPFWMARRLGRARPQPSATGGRAN